MAELTEQQKADIERLKNMPEDEIDTSDIPVVLGWNDARRGETHLPAAPFPSTREG